MKVSFWGEISTTYGRKYELDCPDKGFTISELRDFISIELGFEDVLSSKIRAAVNDVFVREDCVVRNTDNVAFMSPLSGG